MGKILDIETRLASSYEQTSSMFSSNQGFETVLSAEMTGLQRSSDVAATLDELKIQVSQRLASIEKALSKKQQKDRAIQALAEKNRHAFRSGFAKLKQELKEATQYSEELEKKLNQDQLTGAFNRRAYDKKIKDDLRIKLETEKKKRQEEALKKMKEVKEDYQPKNAKGGGGMIIFG